LTLRKLQPPARTHHRYRKAKGEPHRSTHHGHAKSGPSNNRKRASEEKRGTGALARVRIVRLQRLRQETTKRRSTARNNKSVAGKEELADPLPRQPEHSRSWDANLALRRAQNQAVVHRRCHTSHQRSTMSSETGAESIPAKPTAEKERHTAKEGLMRMSEAHIPMVFQSNRQFSNVSVRRHAPELLSHT
jgi:hypothetical protein